MRATGGFTLLEVLVAFVIAAMALTLLGMAGVAGLRGATLSARYQEAVVRARSRLAVLQVAPVPGDRQGDDGDGFHWHVRVTPLATADLPATHRFGSAGMPSQHLSLLSVAVAVSWGTGAHAVELQTEQVVQGTLTSP
ncbi:MAG: type IV pilus modification PilV family protein [Janthinobacterium lividum]